MRLRVRWDQTALAVWAVVLLGVAVHGYLYPQIHTVYDIYGSAARNWWDATDMYVLGKDYYRYSPLFAVAITPFALLPDNWGNALWKIANALVLLAGVRAFLRHGLPVRLNRTEMAAVFLLVLPGALHSLHIGQANLLMLGAVLFAVAAAARERWTATAAWLAAATLVKGYPLALALLLAALYPRRFALRYLGALAAGLILPFATQAPEIVVAQYTSWFDHLCASEHIMCDRMRSLIYLAQTYGAPVSPMVFTLMGVLAGAGILGACALCNGLTNDRRQQLTWVLETFSVWGILFGPFTESCTYILAAPAVAWELLDTFRRRAWWGARLLAAASLLLMGPLATDAFGPGVRQWAEAYAAQPIGGLLFLTCLALKAGCTFPCHGASEEHALPLDQGGRQKRSCSLLSRCTVSAIRASSSFSSLAR